jgi:hypothetical protein
VLPAAWFARASIRAIAADSRFQHGVESEEVTAI